jgi:hypothetical protein
MFDTELRYEREAKASFPSDEIAAEAIGLGELGRASSKRHLLPTLPMTPRISQGKEIK